MDVGRVDHGHRQRQPLADAERQRVRPFVHHAGKVEARCAILGDAPGIVSGGRRNRRCVQVEVQPHRQLGVER